MSIDIGGVRLNGTLGLAPMAGVADMAFRRICREQGAAYTVTEMVSAKALCYGDKKTPRLLELAPGEHPAAAQIFGSEPDICAEGARLALALSGADIIDINMGCPMPKISGNREGAALMLEPALAEAIVSAVVRAVGVPVTVKFRKGYDGERVNCAEFARVCEAAGASALCIHGRTREQMYAGRADTEAMAAVVAAVKIPVMVNGDVDGPESARRLLGLTGSGFSLAGRAALGNPWLFSGRTPDLAEKLDTLIRQTLYAASQKGERVACTEARKHAAWYLSGIKNAAAWRQKAYGICSLDTLRAFCRYILEENGGDALEIRS